MGSPVVKLRPEAPPAPPQKRIHTKIVFQRERFADIVTDLGPLMRLHDREIWPGRKWGKLQPNIVQYLSMEQQGILHVLTARTGNGRLIGYSMEIVVLDLHFGIKSALNDTIFLHPDYRVGKGLSLRKHPGMRLLRERERMLDDMKVERRRISAKAWLMFGPLLERMGYEAEAVIYHRIVSATATEDE